MATEVSISPRWARWASGTGVGILRRNAVEVSAKPGQLDAWSTTEHGDGGLGAYEPESPKGSQFSHGNAIPGDDEGLAPV